MDYHNVGMKERWWSEPFLPPMQSMPVPSSYNDIVQETASRDHIGWVWYETYFWLPSYFQSQRVVLHFEGASHYAIVWLNDILVVEHEGGHLPFEAEVTYSMHTSFLNRLVVGLNNTLSPTTIPPGEVIIYNGSNPMYPKGYTKQVTYFDECRSILHGLTPQFSHFY